MPLPQITVYSRTTAYRHDSIGAGVACVGELGRSLGFGVAATEEPDELVRMLPDSEVVVFLSTSGDVLTDAGRTALREHLAAGRGFVGIHAAACTEYNWPYFGRMLGARFAGHPEPQDGTVVVRDRDHPATAHLPARWTFHDEWYNFDAVPGPGTRVLAAADESTYDGGLMGEEHPLVWCHELLIGRVFYTALGHFAQAYEDPDFRAHLKGGVAYAARSDAGPGPASGSDRHPRQRTGRDGTTTRGAAAVPPPHPGPRGT